MRRNRKARARLRTIIHDNLHTALPVRLSQFIAAANDENGKVTIANVTIGQLVFGIRCKLDRLSPHHRWLTAMFAAGAVAGCAGKEAGHG